MNFKILPQRHTLLSRMVFYIFLFTAFMLVLTASWRSYYSYHAKVQAITEELDNLVVSQLDTLINNLWSLNQPAIDIQLQSILNNPSIVFIELHDVDGSKKTLGEKPDEQLETIIKRNFPLIRLDRGKEIPLGQISFHATTQHVNQQILQALTFTLWTDIASLFITCFFILFLFIVLFNRHLHKIVEYTKTLGIATLDQEFHLDRHSSKDLPDELDQIVQGLNEMQQRLREGMQAQHHAEEHLLQEKVFIDTLINSLPMLLLVLNQNLQIVRYNRMLEELTGLSQDDILKFNIKDLFSVGSRQEVFQAVRKIFKSGDSMILKTEIVGKNGLKIPYYFSGTLLEIDEERYLIGLGLDLSEQKKVEDELRQAQKMESIGTLAGGIAHDFNNILSVIMGYEQLMSAAVSKESREAEWLEQIHHATLRARDLVKQILTFSRKGDQEKKPLDMALLLKESVKMLRSTIPTTIDIKCHIESSGMVLADLTQIHQIIMNLCTNAYHAMQTKGGQLNLHLTRVRVDTHLQQLQLRDLPPGEYVCLEVRDNGSGMDSAMLDNIFEPYFTTKEKGAGTGLGLAVVHGIVNDHNGKIHVESSPGQGTVFRVYLPAISEQGGKSDPAVNGSVKGGNERILIVDDEAELAKMLSAILQMHGYRVTVENNSETALQNFLQNPETIDLLITDQTMPRLTGYELGKKIRNQRPDLPLILCTGYSETINSQKALEAGFTSFMLKPVSSDVLLKEVRAALDRNTEEKDTRNFHNS